MGEIDKEIELIKFFQCGGVRRDRDDKFVFDFEELLSFNPTLYEEIVKDFREDYKLIRKLIFERYSVSDSDNCEIIFRGLKEKKEIGEIRKEDVGKVIVIRGVITKKTKPLAILVRRTFTCLNCLASIYVEADKTPVCPYCGNKTSKMFKLTESLVEDMMEVEVEEMVDFVEKEKPEKIRVRLTNELTSEKYSKLLQPGNKVEIVGIVDLIPLPKRNRQREEIYEFKIFAISVNSLEEEFSEELITSEDIKKIEEISRNDPLEVLSNSLAPDLHGLELVKKAIVLQMVRGVKKVYPGGKVFRDRIHILLVGEPSTGKTQLAKNVILRMPKSHYASGESSTKAGILATVEKDELLGSWSLKGGAICKANNSVLIIDELDKLSKEDRDGLHTPLESGEIPINKAGISTTLKADCCVLALCNPRSGLFDPYLSLVEQVNLPPPLLSRFDLLFVLKDEINEISDKKIVELIYSARNSIPTISIDLFRKYIAYAKKLKPKLPDYFKDELFNFYHNLRKKAMKEGSNLRGLPIGPRYLEGLIRLAEASAKIRLSEEVNIDDIKLAEELFYNSLVKLGLDEDTGILDFARIGPGKRINKRLRAEIILKTLKDLNTQVKPDTLLQLLEEKGLDRSECEKLIEELHREGSILMGTHGYYVPY